MNIHQRVRCCITRRLNWTRRSKRKRDKEKIRPPLCQWTLKSFPWPFVNGDSPDCALKHTSISHTCRCGPLTLPFNLICGEINIVMSVMYLSERVSNVLSYYVREGYDINTWGHRALYVFYLFMSWEEYMPCSLSHLYFTLSLDLCSFLCTKTYICVSS